MNIPSIFKTFYWWVRLDLVIVKMVLVPLKVQNVEKKYVCFLYFAGKKN